MASNFYEVSYALWVTQHTQRELPTYYISQAVGVHILAVGDNICFAATITSDADIADWEANHKPNSIEVANQDEAIVLSAPEVHAGQSFSGESVPTSGVGSGDFVPTAARAPISVARNQVSPLNLDAEGQLMQRGPVFSDEGSFRDDFPGTSLNTPLTGTVTIESGSVVVNGVGTAFLSETDRDTYIKVTTDGEVNWVLVARVVSDTLLETESPYAGAAGEGLSAHATKWPTATGAGSSGITVSGGTVIIPSGVGNNEQTRIVREGDYLPLVLCTRLMANQRIANQECIFGAQDDPTAPGSQAVVVLSGTDRTKVMLRSSCGTGTTEIDETWATLPPGLRTDIMLRYRIVVSPTSVALSVNEILIATNRLHIPAPYDSMYTVAGVNNIGVPASSTTLTVDSAMLMNHDTTAIGQPNDPVPVVQPLDSTVKVKQERATAGHYRPIPIVFAVPTAKVRYYDWIVPARTNGTDWLALLFNAGDVTSGDEIVMGKGFLGVIAQVAANASSGDTSITIASTANLSATLRGGYLDEGFFLSFGTEATTAGPTDGSLIPSLNYSADQPSPGNDNNPNAELPEYEIGTLRDQDASGVTTIGLLTPLAANISAGTPVNLVVRVINDPIPVTKGADYNFGGHVLTAGALPGGTKIRFGFRNNSGADEMVRAVFETLY